MVWTSFRGSLHTQTIGDAFSNLNYLSAYDNIALAAYGHFAADWYVGMNITRALTTRYRKTVNIGRVSAFALHMVAERTRIFQKHKKASFWTVQVQCQGVKFETERYDTKDKAIEQFKDFHNRPIAVRKLARTTETAKVPKLYNLTALQRDAVKYCGMDTQTSLNALINLYEKRLITYPKTSSCYVMSSHKEELNKLISLGIPQNILEHNEPEVFNLEQVVNDERTKKYSAILPTKYLTRDVFNELSEQERKIARLICARLLVALEPNNTIYKKTTIEARCVETKLTSTVVNRVQDGWEALQDELLGTKRRAVNPASEAIKEGAFLRQDSDALNIHEGYTEATPLLDDGLLLGIMDKPGRYLSDQTLKEAIKGNGIGTPATRTTTINDLINNGYVERRNGKLVATELGLWLDSVMPHELTDAALSANWEYDLNRIENGNYKLEEFIDKTIEFTTQMVEEVKATQSPGKRVKESFGSCPRCGKPVYKNNRENGWHCSSYRIINGANTGCGFYLHDHCFEHVITDFEARRLLSGEKIVVSDCKDGNGKRIRVTIEIDKDSKYGTKATTDDSSGNQAKTIKLGSLARPESAKPEIPEVLKQEKTEDPANSLKPDDVEGLLNLIAGQKSKEDAKALIDLWGEEPDIPRTREEIIEMLKWAAETRKTQQPQPRPAFMSRKHSKN